MLVFAWLVQDKDEVVAEKRNSRDREQRFPMCETVEVCCHPFLLRNQKEPFLLFSPSRQHGESTMGQPVPQAQTAPSRRPPTGVSFL